MTQFKECMECGHTLCKGCKSVNRTADGYDRECHVCGGTEWSQDASSVKRPVDEYVSLYSCQRCGHKRCPSCREVSGETECCGCGYIVWVHNDDKKKTEGVGKCPVCGGEGHKKTMAALAEVVGDRLWENIEKKAEKLISEELSAIDEILEAYKSEIQIPRTVDHPHDPDVVTRYGEMLKTRADMRTKAISNLLVSKTTGMTRKAD